MLLSIMQTLLTFSLFLCWVYSLKMSLRDPSLCDPKYAARSYLQPHPEYCDKFISCQKGIGQVYQCDDGLAYLPSKGCRPLHSVDCSSRPLLQPPRGNGLCPRRHGIFPDERGCGRFFKCINGTAIPDKCPPGLMFDEKKLECHEGSKEELEQCQELALLGCIIDPISGDLNSCTWFRCPHDDTYPFGDHSRHPYPGNCRFFIICARGGFIKIQGCPKGSVYDVSSSTCVQENESNACQPTMPNNSRFDSSVENNRGRP